MNEPVQLHSDIIEQLQSKIQALTDENRLLKQRMDEAGIFCMLILWLVAMKLHQNDMIPIKEHV